MKKFLIRLLFFTLFFLAFAELFMRLGHLAPDTPRRMIDQQYQVQIYQQGQSGYYRGVEGKNKWRVNNYGWLGFWNLSRRPLIAVVGDSFIENIMNPPTSNQAYLLQKYFPQYGFIEAGRSGVTFIEAIQITKMLGDRYQPDYYLLYVHDEDFFSSIADIKRASDKLQVDLVQKQLLPAKLKAPALKNILYSIKLAYYLYLKFPLDKKLTNSLLTKQKSADQEQSISQNNDNNQNLMETLLQYTCQNYCIDNCILVFQPNSSKQIIDLVKKFGFRVIELLTTEKSWQINIFDSHWSVYGHNQAAIQVREQLKNLLKQN